MTSMSATDIAAWWGAGIATVVVLWDIFKWRRGRATQVRITANPNMQEYFPGEGFQEPKFVFVEITNVGDRTTTLTNLCGFHYSSWWKKLFNKQTQAFVVADPAPGVIPHELEPGKRWTGRIGQTQQMENWSRNGRLYVAVYHTLAKKAELIRLVIPIPDEKVED